MHSGRGRDSSIDGRRFDPRRILDSPLLFKLSALVMRPQEWRIFAEEYVRAQPGERILDVGCGPGDLLGRLPEGVEYIGFDASARYIRSAERRFGHRGRFVRRTVDRAVVEELGPGSFDIVVAHGVLHHLDDERALEFFALARGALRPGGRLVAGDGCYVPGQSRAARYFLARDRGRFVRTEDAYLALARRYFTRVVPALRHDTFRIPYTMLFLECVA